MNNWKYKLAVGITKSLNVILLTISFSLCWFFFYASRIVTPLYSVGNYAVAAMFLIIYVLLCKIYDALLVSLKRISDMIYSQVLSVFLTDCIMYLVICLLANKLDNPVPIIVTFGVQVILSVIWSFSAHRWYFYTFPPRKSAIVYDMRQGMENLIKEYGLAKKFRIEFTMSVDECLDDLAALDGMDSVFMSGIHSHDRNIILKYCVDKGINVYVIPRIGDVIMSGAQQMHMFHLPMLRVGRCNPSVYYTVVKRVFDVVVSGIAIVVLSPVILVTSIAIKATDGGPVFYKQVRLTKDGKHFNVLKFRSMRVDAEKDGVARLSTGDKDDRVTPVGRIIRKIRVDELPQLFNILRGDMTICGPRPERPEIAAQYEQEIPEFRLRLQVKAGLTGYAQVYGKYNTTPYDKLQMDLMYIAHLSLLEDLKIMFATIKILFMSESTEGVAEGAATAIGQERSAELTAVGAESGEDA